MSLPQFPNPDTILDTEQAINAILTSIAMEETALSHIINAEGEKIQFAIERVKSCNSNADIEKLLEVNESASNLLEQVTDMQILLKNKLRHAISFLPKPHDHPCSGHPDPCHPDFPCHKPGPGGPCDPDCPCHEPGPGGPCHPDFPCHEPGPGGPCGPDCPCHEPGPGGPCDPDCPCQKPGHTDPCKPDCPCQETKPKNTCRYCFSCSDKQYNNCNEHKSCTAAFSAANEYSWTGGSTLYIRQDKDCNNGVKLCRKNCESFIILSAGKKFQIDYDLELVNKYSDPVSVDIKLCNRNGIMKIKDVFVKDTKYHLKSCDSLIWETPSGCEGNILRINLTSLANIKINKGTFCITEIMK